MTLTGQVLSVGGIMEKVIVIAARRAGAKRPILSEANPREYDEVPQHIRENLTVYFATRHVDVAAQVFPA